MEDNMNAISLLYRKFENVSFFYDRELDFSAIIAIHNTVRGPSLGGCRVRQYESLESALYDVLRLAEGMTYKNALAELSLGGGKSVIIPSEKALSQRELLFKKFATWVHSLGGKYITAEDMGTSVEDIKVVSRVTPFVSGSDPEKGGGGDPSPFTARGVFYGIGACLERVFGTGDYVGKTVLIQGIGHVGFHLAKLLREAGARVVVSDVSSENIQKAKAALNVEACEVSQVYSYQADVFSPCAIGAILNQNTIPMLQCKIVAGAANNQLEFPDDESRLKDRGILYAPDFAINSGGVINCAAEFLPQGYSEQWVTSLVSNIGKTVGTILDTSKSSGKLAGEVAIDLAKERIKS